LFFNPGTVCVPSTGGSEPLNAALRRGVQLLTIKHRIMIKTAGTWKRLIRVNGRIFIVLSLA
jgi:hypothetical protein